MMAALDHDSNSREPRSLYAILAGSARAASDATLAALTAIGGVTIVALAAMRPRWWIYALVPVIAGAYGLWGILERGVAERGAARPASYERVVGVAQGLCIAVGAIAAMITAFALLGIFIGPFIS